MHHHRQTFPLVWAYSELVGGSVPDDTYSQELPEVCAVIHILSQEPGWNLLAGHNFKEHSSLFGHGVPFKGACESKSCMSTFFLKSYLMTRLIHVIRHDHPGHVGNVDLHNLLGLIFREVI